MKKLILILTLVSGLFSLHGATAQKVIKDASANVFIDVSDMPTKAVSTTTLNKVVAVADAGNTLYRKLQIAKNDLPSKITWSEALGILTTYNGASAIGQTQGTVNTGCKAYSAEGYAGSWRVPTIKELQLMWIMRDGLVKAGVTKLNTYHWSATDYSASNCWWVNFDNGVSGFDLSKSGTQLVRCVREVN